MAIALRELFAHFKVLFDRKPLKQGNAEIDKTRDKLKKTDDIADRLAGSLRGLGAALVAGFGVDAMIGFAQSTLESTNELMRWSSRLNMSVTELRGWTGAAAQFGADVDDVTDALKELQLKAQDALTGGTAQAEMFDRIGISLDDLRPVVNDSSQLMELFTRRLDAVNDEGLRNFTVDELMSDAGTRMLPLFRQGAEAIDEMRKAAEKRSRNIEKLARQQSRLNRVTAVSKMQLESLAASVLIKLLPPLTKIAEKGGKIVESISNVVEKSNVLEAALITLAGIAAVFAIATIGIWGPFALAAIAIALIVIAIDDFITALRGGDSIIEEFLDSLGYLFDSPRFGKEFFSGLRKGFIIINGAMGDGRNLSQSLGEAIIRLWRCGEDGQRFVALILGALKLVIDGFTAYFEFLPRWWSFVFSIFAGAYNYIANWVAQVGEIFGYIKDEILPAFSDAWHSTTSTILVLVGSITDAIDSIVGSVQGAINAVSSLNGVRGILSSLPGVGRFFGGGGQGATTTTTPTTGTTTTTTPQVAANNVTSSMSNNIVINGATDPAAVGRQVDQRINAAMERQARQLQGALVSQ